LAGAGILGFASLADAFVLPYTDRTQDFSAWTPATQGDTNTIGMAGATVALPTSISSAEPNPAGYAMMTASVSAQINNTNFNDSRLQRSGESLTSQQWGLGVSPDKWGFAIAYYSPQTESGTYVAPAIGDAVKSEVSLKELRFTVSRRLWDESLAVGFAFEIAKAVRELGDASANAITPSFQLGILKRFPSHLTLGASFVPELRVGPAGHPDDQNAIPGFNRAVVRPSLLSFGAGWIPNRYFKVGTSLTAVGRTVNTALFADQSVTTGASMTFVPRAGASYVVAEYAHFKMEAALGGYYESSRLSNQADRLHATLALDVNPSFINLGAALDLAAGYHAYIFSTGIDIVRTARFFKLIPPEPVPPYNGKFPPPAKVSPEGLPAGLTADEHKKYEEANVTEVGKIVSKVPENLQKKLEGQKTSVEIQEAHGKGARRGRTKKQAPKSAPSPSPVPSSSPTSGAGVFPAYK
jgi:hypothetical protein